MKNLITLLTFALMAATFTLAGCEVPLDQPVEEAQRPLGDLAGDALEQDDLPTSKTRDGDDDGFEALAADDPSGQILVADVEISVEVGELLVITFDAELIEIAPEDTYFTFEALPEGALVDFETGIFEWTPTPVDIGTHVIGLDLWDSDAERVLDAQRIAIEVLPGTSLIEVGI